MSAVTTSVVQYMNSAADCSGVLICFIFPSERRRTAVVWGFEIGPHWPASIPLELLAAVEVLALEIELLRVWAAHGSHHVSRATHVRGDLTTQGAPSTLNRKVLLSSD